MNKPIKIILLVVAILLAVGGIMVYYKTIVSPPTNLVFSNQFVVSCKEDINNVKSANTDLALDTLYTCITHELDFMLENTQITTNERDELMESFACNYAKSYSDFCNSTFSQPEWDEKQLNKMKDRIAELKDLCTTDFGIIIKGDDDASLNKILSVISNFYEAKRLASSSGYNGIQSAKERITKARQYANMTPINNCRELLNNLNMLSSRLNDAHYAYLRNQVERLIPYMDYYQDSYDQLAISISNKIDEYKKNAQSVYGQVHSVKSLEDKAGEYYGKASFDEHGYPIKNN